LYENDKRFDVKQLLQIKTIREFDRKFAISFGYETVEDYHRDCKFDSKLNHIQVPTLFLTAADDMFSPKRGSYVFSPFGIQIYSKQSKYYFLFNRNRF
jgi:predicted alpha/beta-fold hydrolase